MVSDTQAIPSEGVRLRVRILRIAIFQLRIYTGV